MALHISHNVGGVRGLHVAYNVISPKEEQALTLAHFGRDLPRSDDSLASYKQSHDVRPTDRVIGSGSGMPWRASPDARLLAALRTALEAGLCDPPGAAAAAAALVLPVPDSVYPLLYLPPPRPPPARGGGLMMPHCDSWHKWGAAIFGVSLGAAAELTMRRGPGDAEENKVRVLLPRGSIYALTGEARRPGAGEARRPGAACSSSEWEHSVWMHSVYMTFKDPAAVPQQPPLPAWNHLGLRYSLTLRCSRTWEALALATSPLAHAAAVAQQRSECAADGPERQETEKWRQDGGQAPTAAEHAAWVAGAQAFAGVLRAAGVPLLLPTRAVRAAEAAAVAAAYAAAEVVVVEDDSAPLGVPASQAYTQPESVFDEQQTQPESQPL